MPDPSVSPSCSLEENFPQAAAQEILAAAVTDTFPTCQQLVATSFDLGQNGNAGALAV